MKSYLKAVLAMCLGLGFGSTAAFAQINVEKLLASDGSASDSFGRAVSIAGDRALVGAYLDDDMGTDSGAAYVYVRSGGTWVEEAKLLPTDGESGDSFGYSASLSQVGTVSYAVVGAYRDDDKGTDAGAVYVFTRSGTTWSQQRKLTASDGSAGDSFGVSVSVSSYNTTYGHILVGAHKDDDSGTDSGSAYAFHRIGSSWSQQAKLVPVDGASGDYFGVSVSVSSVGTWYAYGVVGAHGDDDLGSSSGSAYAYYGNSSTWTQQTKLKAADGVAGDTFGGSVSLSGARALVGAYGNDDHGNNSGSAYMFVRSGVVWSQESKLLASDGGSYDYFGYSVSLSDARALVGAYGDDDKG